MIGIVAPVPKPPRPTPGIPDRNRERPSSGKMRLSRPALEINAFPPPITTPPPRPPTSPQESASNERAPTVQLEVETTPAGHRAPRITFELGSAGWWGALFAGLAAAGITIAGWVKDQGSTKSTTQDYGSQIQKLEERVGSCETKRSDLEKRVVRGENWNAAVLSQALGVDIRRPDNAEPLPALRITWPLKKPNHVDPHAPLVIVETVQPTGP